MPFITYLRGEVSLTSPTVINVPTRASLADQTKGFLFLWLAHLNNKNTVCKQIPSLLVPYTMAPVTVTMTSLQNKFTLVFVT